MSFLAFPEPPTKEALASARRSLDATRTSVEEVSAKILAAEAALAQIIDDSRRAICDMETQRNDLDAKMTRTLAYLSPIRRMPMELLRMVFLQCFEENPCSPWRLAAVCSSWRRLALRIPAIWSKIRLRTTQHASADTIRLWLERSGDSVPLDIEIILRVATKPGETVPTRLRRPSASPASASAPWFPGPPAVFTLPHLPPPTSINNVTIVMPPSPTNQHDSHHERSSSGTSSRVSMHWGHIAFFYLVEQMHRWERFVFRFDKQFVSIGALKSITGDAPLLKEFEVSSTEAAFFAEWPWLPNVGPGANVSTLPSLRTLTLHHTPFKWSSPVLRNLHVLNLRALPISHLPLDRILFILSNNPELKSVSLHFQGVLAPVLPLSTVTLPNVTTFSLGGHPLLTQLLDSLILPNVDSLTLDIEARDPIEDIVSGLLTRSNRPPVQHLSLAYGLMPNVANFYYGPGGIVITWNTLLAELPLLKSLHIGGTSVEPLLSALGPPEDDPNNTGPSTLNNSNNANTPAWVCPNLESIAMKSCHAHGEGVQRLVQMVEARNPQGGQSPLSLNGVTPVRLTRLELHDCAALGEDIMKWLEQRVAEVVCVDPSYERTTMAHAYI